MAVRWVFWRIEDSMRCLVKTSEAGPHPLYCKDALRIVYIFSLKHRCETWACCVNGDRSRIIAARSGSNNQPVGSYEWPCEVEDHIDSRYVPACERMPRGRCTALPVVTERTCLDMLVMSTTRPGAQKLCQLGPSYTLIFSWR